MYSEQQLKAYLVEWFNLQPIGTRTIASSDLPLFRLRVTAGPGDTRTVVIGSDVLADGVAVELEVLYVWIGGRGENLFASDSSFLELLQSKHSADYIANGEAHKFFTADMVRNTRLIGLNKLGNLSTTISAADTVLDAIGILAGKVEDYRNRNTHYGSIDIGSITNLQTTLTAIETSATAPLKTVTGTSYTLTDADNGKFIEFTASTAITVTIPTHASGNISSTSVVGSPTFHLCQAGTGTVTVVAASGVTLLKPASMSASTLEREAVVTVKRRGSNSYRIFGLLGAA